MSPQCEASGTVQRLIETYSRPSEGRKKAIVIVHSGFEHLPKGTRNFIQRVLQEVYRGDFEILRKAFVEKMEIFLRLISAELQKAQCSDENLLQSINVAREKVAQVVRVNVSDEDIRWLKTIGFLPVDIIELASKLSVSGLVAGLRENIDEYLLILKDQKYIVKILKMHNGVEKLQRLQRFYRTYDNSIVTFNSFHLSQIVLGAGWEEKLKYFEDPAKLQRLTAAGFEASHLSQIVLGAGWEEKLKYFEDPAKVQRLTEAGFNGYHLSQIVLGAGWEEKLRVAMSESCLTLLQDGHLTRSKLVILFRTKNWRVELRTLGVDI